LTPHAPQAGRQKPVLEGGAVTQCSRFSGEHWHVMPGIVDRRAAAKAATMLADDCAILADYNAIGIGLDLDRPPHGARGDRVLIIVEAYQAGLRDRRLRRVEPVEWPSNPHELRPLLFESLPDRAVGQLGMLVRFGIDNTSVEQPGVQLVIACHPQPWCEETLTHHPDLVLDLPLFPARGRRAGSGLDQVMATHPQKAAVELAVFADEHGFDRRLHVVVDAARAGPLEESKGAIVRVD